MSVSAKFKSDYHIQQRREYEHKEAVLHNSIKGDKNVYLKAAWEHKTDRSIVKNRIQSRVEFMKKRHESDVQTRRNKLAALLASEDQIYEAEFLASLETPEQVRANMAERLATLKDQREQERQAIVNQALDRKFKMETDELRKEETNFMIAGCQIEREKQLMDKKSRIEQNIVEEQVYAKLWMLDQEKKVQREQKEALQKRNKIQETVNILTWQADSRAQAVDQSKLQKIREQDMLKTQWANEIEADKEQERQKFLLNRERNLELIQHNAAEKELRNIQIDQDKLRDKDLLAAQLSRQQALNDIEDSEKLRRRQEVVELQKYYKQSEDDKAAYQKLVDQFVEAEAERQYKMREAQWQREEQARINLLKDVYVSREKDVLLKQQKKQEMEWLRNHEREAIEKSIAQQNAEFEARAAKEASTRKNHQGDLLKQMNEKDRIQRTFLQEKMYEERAAKLAELDYQRKISTDKQQNATMLSQWKSSVNY